MSTKKSRAPLPVWTELGQQWNAWWFQEADSQPLSAVRIGAGIVLLIYILSWGNAARWIAVGGLLPVSTTNEVVNVAEWDGFVLRGLQLLGDSRTVVWGVQITLALAALLLACGYFTRVTAVVAWLLFLWFAHRVTLVAGGVEPILATLLFYLAWSPCNDYWSVDAALRPKAPKLDGVAKKRAEIQEAAARPKPRGRFAFITRWLPSRGVCANIAIKALQIHLAMLVATMALNKLSAPAWSDGEAIWYLTASTQSRPIDLTFLRRMPLVVNAWTHAVVVIETLFVVLIWLPKLRPSMLVAGLLAWFSLPLVTGEWLFPLAMFAAVLVFASPKWWARPVNDE